MLTSPERLSQLLQKMDECLASKLYRDSSAFLSLFELSLDDFNEKQRSIIIEANMSYFNRTINDNAFLQRLFNLTTTQLTVQQRGTILYSLDRNTLSGYFTGFNDFVPLFANSMESFSREYRNTVFECIKDKLPSMYPDILDLFKIFNLSLRQLTV